MALIKCKGEAYKEILNPYSKSFSGNNTYYVNPVKPVRNLRGSLSCGHGTRCGNRDWVGGMYTEIAGLNKKTGEWQRIAIVYAPGNGDQCPPGMEWSYGSFNITDDVVYTNIRVTGYWSGTGSFVTSVNAGCSISYWEQKIW